MEILAKLGSRLVLMVSGRGVLLLLSLVVTAILTRLLGPAGFGQYRASVAYLGLIVVLADLGLTSIFTREISRQDADQAKIVSNALALRLAIAIIIFLSAIGLAFVMPFDASERLGVLGGAAGFVAYSIHLMLFGLFQQRLRQQGAILAEVVGGIALLGMIIVFSRLGARPETFVAVLGTSYVLTLVISLWFARRMVPFRISFDWPQWRDLIRFSLPLAGASTLLVIYIRADSVLLALLQTPEAVGLYGVPVKIFDSLMGIALLVVGLIAPLLARSAHTDLDEFRRVLGGGLGAAMVGSIGIALGLVVLSEEIVTVLAGAAFVESATILQVLALLFVLHTASLLLREAAVALDVQRRLVFVYFVGMLVAFAAYFTLIPRLAGLGAALALVLAESLVLIGAFRIVARETLLRANLKMCLGAILSGCVAGLAAFGVRNLEWSWWLSLLAALSAYTIMLLVSRTIRWAMLLSVIREFSPRRRKDV
jgi:O-antigen/teichoic acid export membrane protein